MSYTESRAREAHRGNACKLGRSFVCKFEALAAIGAGRPAECAPGPNLLRSSVDKLQVL